MPLSDQNVAVNEEDEELDTNPFQFDPLSPPNTLYFLPNSNNNPISDTESDPESIRFDGEESDFDQMNFITDLFSPCEQYPRSNFSPFGLESEFDQDLGLGLEFGPDSQLGELGQSGLPCGADSSIGGLRVVGLESDSDSEEFVRDSDPFGDPSVSLFWDGGEIDEENEGTHVLEWEEVGEQRILERDALGSVIERIEELSVSSEISNIGREEMGDGDLEWEFLLAVNNLERNLEFENESFGEYDEIFGQIMENVASSKGSPPTAKSVVENLPIVVFSEEMKKENVICAVCKDDISTEDRVTKLPCAHFYHGDCIVPWLSIRNTCPVCRYELPTDDPDYERKKMQETDTDLSRDMLIRVETHL